MVNNIIAAMMRKNATLTPRFEVVVLLLLLAANEEVDWEVDPAAADCVIVGEVTASCAGNSGKADGVVVTKLAEVWVRMVLVVEVETSIADKAAVSQAELTTFPSPSSPIVTLPSESLQRTNLPGSDVALGDAVVAVGDGIREDAPDMLRRVNIGDKYVIEIVPSLD